MLNLFFDRTIHIRNLASNLDIVVPDFDFTTIIKDDKLTYHNIFHMLAVCEEAFKAIGLYGIKLTYTEQQLLFLSCLLHDKNHLQVGGNDFLNIQKAITYVQEHLQDWLPKHSVAHIDVLKEYVCSTIACTEFPFKHTPTTTVQKIIRDCDLLMLTLPDGGLFLRGLCNELGLSNENYKGIHAVQEHKKFMTSIQWFTQYGRNQYYSYYVQNNAMVDSHWEHVIETFNKVV